MTGNSPSGLMGHKAVNDRPPTRQLRSQQRLDLPVCGEKVPAPAPHRRRFVLNAPLGGRKPLLTPAGRLVCLKSTARTFDFRIPEEAEARSTPPIDNLLKFRDTCLNKTMVQLPQHRTAGVAGDQENIVHGANLRWIVGSLQVTSQPVSALRVVLQTKLK